jgi:methionyl-tRNA formyltransferase
MEAYGPFQHLIEQRENITGLVTLEGSRRSSMSGGVDLSPLAQQAQIPVLEVRNVNDTDSVRWIQSMTPDVLLVIGWTQLLKTELLRTPKIACLGFHASLLPKYRGRAPVNWAIIHGETETGNTMITLEPEADTGDIVAQRKIAISDEDDCRTVYEKVGQTEIEMLDEVLPLIRRGFLPRQKQDDTKSSVMPKRRPEDGIIDWSRSTREVFNWVRALTEPYPGAFSLLDGMKVWIWTARPVENALEFKMAEPGTVIHDRQGWPLVATGDGWIRVLSAQREGESKVSGQMAAAEFLKAGNTLGVTQETTN